MGTRLVCGAGELGPELSGSNVCDCRCRECQARAVETNNTPIPTPAGWATMGSLSVGDAVLDSAGEIKNSNTVLVGEYMD